MASTPPISFPPSTPPPPLSSPTPPATSPPASPVTSPPPPATSPAPPATSPPAPPATSPTPPTTSPPPPAMPPAPPATSPPAPPATSPPAPPTTSPPAPPATSPTPPTTSPPPPAMPPAPPATSPPAPPATSPTPPTTSPPPPAMPPAPPATSPPAPPATSPPAPPSINQPPSPATSPAPPPPKPPEISPPPLVLPPMSPQPPSKPKPEPPPPPPPLLPPVHVTPPPPPLPPFHAPPPAPPTSGEGISTGGIVAIALACGVAVLAIIVGATCGWKRRKKASRGSDSAHPMLEMPKVGDGSEGCGLNTCRSEFRYEELAVATDGFSADNFLGEGGFGCVHKGVLADGTDVAVKQLKVGGSQGEREFTAEVGIISRIHHRHLVSLIGYCISGSRKLLVYDYVPNNSLHFHLHGEVEGRPVLDWATRVKISKGAARGIAYLHEDCNPRIIHRDIKSSNILLDSNFEARVSDFGLAKLALDETSHVSTRVVGTFGYMAPEYASTGNLTEKSDVFSFGVVLLELITGRKPVQKSPLSDEVESLVDWARPLLSKALKTKELRELADERLKRQYVEREMLGMVEVAANCVRRRFLKRPNMGQVVRALERRDLISGASIVMENAKDAADIKMLRRMAFTTGSEDITIGSYVS